MFHGWDSKVEPTDLENQEVRSDVFVNSVIWRAIGTVPQGYETYEKVKELHRHCGMQMELKFVNKNKCEAETVKLHAKHKLSEALLRNRD